MTEPPEEIRWDIARSKMTQLGSVPASFSSLIRKLRADMQSSPPVLSSVAQYELKRLLRGPALLSPMAHAALEFHPDKLGDVKDLSKAVIEAFSLEELSALIGTLYLTRQVKKRCNEEEWKYIIEFLVPNSTLAGHLGAFIPPIGFERSLSAVTFTVLGMALFQSTAAKEYSAYRRYLKKNNTYFSIKEELRCFGCTSKEIASLLSQTVALSSSMASEFLAGVETEPGKRPANGIQALNIWISSLNKNKTAPQVAMDAKWFPTKEKVEQIEAMAKKVELGNSISASWIIKEGSDLESLKQLLAKNSHSSASEISVEIDENIEPFVE